MHTISLNGHWTLTYGPQHGDGIGSPGELAQAGWPTIPATVPGNVELDLVAAGEIEDPSTGSRIYALRELETYQWWYRRSFPSPSLDPGQRCELVFGGLDCLGTIWLNGEPVGVTDNMLIPHRFDVTGLLRRGRDNELAVRIDSAVLAGQRRPPSAIEGASPCRWESLSIRKAPHVYGWDIMPRAVSAGLWRGVALHVVDPTHLRQVYWATLHADPDQRRARLMVDWDLASEQPGAGALRVRVTLRRQGRRVYRAEEPALGTHGRRCFDLDDADLWWPRGYGEPALYDAAVELLDAGGAVLDAHRARIGLRSVELRRTPVTTPQEPGEFLFLVNGTKIFIKGTNWVPLDAFHSRDPQHLPAALEMLADLNCQLVRCWGGNVYEDDAFFDTCDEHGIMVWQDFAFACALYPQDDAFLERVRREARAVVTRLRNHCSLALWAGNNENDDAWSWYGLGHVDPNSDRISRRVLPEVVRRYDPFRPYLPSSPYHSPELVARGSRMEEMPEAHLWGPRGYFKDPFYSAAAHFVSEIGYHGCPHRQSLEEMLDPGFLWPWQDNDQWLTKSVRALPGETSSDYRIALMAQQIAHLFGTIPDDLDRFILASQITQAEALKYFIERCRMDKWRRTGILWWNLRDGWPIISDAVVDYYGRKKLAYATIRRVQVDVCAMVGEAEGGQHPLVVVNDTRRPVRGRVALRDAGSGRALLETEFAVEANGKATAGQIAESPRQGMWLVDWEVEGGGEHHNHYLAGSPPFSLDEYLRWLPDSFLPAT